MASRLTRSQHHDLYFYLRLNRRVDEQLTNLYSLPVLKRDKQKIGAE
jgi:hypothetical protein